MSYSPTIIAASLDDKELQASINKMVANLDKGLQDMLDHTNKKVKEINDALKKVGVTNVSTKGSDDGGAAKRTKAQNAETDAIEKNVAARDKQIKKNKEVEMSFDQMAKAQRQAVSPTSTQAPQIKSARESYLAFVQGFKAQGEAIARQIKDAEAALNKAVENRVNELNTKLANAKTKLNELNVELAKQRMNAERTGNYSTYNAGITRTTQAIEYQMKHIAELQKKISEVSPNMFTQQMQDISALRREQERVANIMKEDVTTRQQSTNATQQQLSAEQKVTDEIHRQAQAIRESKQWREKGVATVGNSVVYNTETNTSFTNKQKQALGSLEEQLLRIQQQQAAEQQRIAASTQETANAEQKVVSEAERRLQIEGSMQETLRKSREIMREMEAQKGGSVATFTPQLESLNKLSTRLKDLRKQYNEMSFGERFGAEGQKIAQNIRIVTRETQKLQAQLARPASLKEALGHPEKTLDDIAYKIQQLRAYMSGLDTSNAKNAQEFQRAAMSADLLKEKQNALLQKNSQLIRSNGQLFASNTALGRSWTYMRNRLAFYFTVGASTQFVRELVDIRSQYEMNERALGILINSAERGTQIFNELSQMALVSPYTLIELSGAAKQLTAYDIAAKDVVDTTRRLADMASAVGVPMERLTYALGQIKAYGYLNSRDNRMFANAGIPLVKQLADYYTELEGKLVSTADVYDRIKKKAVSFEDTMGVIYKMTDEGGKFFDFQEKMAGTLKVQLANLTLAWNNMLNEIGSESQGLLTTGIGALKNFFLAWKDVEKILTDVVMIFGVIKAAQMLSTIAIGKQTIKTLEYVAANELATASEYKRALSIRGINAEQARWLILSNQSNKALISAIYQMGVLDGRSVAILKTLKGLRFGFEMFLLSGKMAINGLIAGFKSLGAAMVSNWPMVLLMAGIDLWQHMSAVSEKNAELNKGIADGAKEATKALGDFLSADDKVQMRLDAQNKKLTQAQGQKAWAAIREQIELSAISAKQIIPELIEIPDINARITKSFELAERIQKATEALSGLEDELEVAQDSWLGGAFGEGLEEDIEDYVERIKKINKAKSFSDASTWEKLTFNTKEHLTTKLSEDITEAESEIRQFANDAAEIIRERLGEEGIKDSIQVGEAVERIIKETEAKFPRIRGVGKKLFESITSDVMGEQFKGVYNSQEQYYKLFLEQLGKDYGSKFRDVTEEIKKDTFDWSEAQEDAIKKTAEDIKKDLPKASQDAIDQILKQLKTTEFKMRIVAQFATTTPNDVQKAFDERFYNMGTLGSEDARNKNIQKYQSFRLKEGENIVEYEKRISDEKKKQLEISQKSQEIISRGGNAAVLKEAKAQKKAAEEYLKNLKEVEKWGGYDFSGDNKKTKGGSSSKKDLLGEAVQKNVQYINEIRKSYEEFKKEGLNATDAVEAATKHFGKSLARNNKELAKYGIQGLTGEQFATMNLQQVRDYFQNMINGAQGSAKAVEILEKEVKNIDAELIKFNQKAIADSLNNELSKLKDEYELAVALDADPEMGNLFAEMWGVNLDALPRTAKEYAEGLTKVLNKYLTDKNTGVSIDNILEMSDSDLGFLDDLLASDDISKEAYDFVKTIVKSARDAYKKETQDISKEWNALVEKYGGLQAKILQIYKKNVQQQASIVKQFGNNEQISKALDLVRKIQISQDPAEIARLQEELAKVLNDVTKNKPIALKTYQATQKEQKSNESKAYWEDFKESDLYTMTFEDMSRNSTRAIQLIIDKLNELKFKVKEDPASMKALTKSLEDANKEFESRSSTTTVVNGIKEYIAATKEVTKAKKELTTANQSVAGSEIALKNAQAVGDANAIADATERLQRAREKQKAAEEKVVKSENKLKAAQEKIKNGLNVLASELQNIEQLLGAVASLFAEAGDEETAEAINAISKGFSIMTTVIMGVVAALILLEATNPWLLAIAAALSVIVGLVSFLSGNSNKKITEQVEESERAVKRLENSYKDLEFAVEHAYGMAEYGAKRAVIANKQLQLVEMQRQLRLEQSRESKYRDNDKILELKGSIIDLRNEIKQSIDDITNDLLGITSVGDAAEQLVSSMIDAFRRGEDYMTHFDESFEDMIDNMIMKAIVSRVIGDRLDEVWEQVKQTAEVRGEAEKKRVDALTKQLSDAQDKQMTAQAKYDNTVQEGLGQSVLEQFQGINTKRDLADANAEVKRVQELLKQAEKDYANAIAPRPEDVQGIRDSALSMRDDVKAQLEAFMEAYGIKAGDRAEDKNLSNLQQGIAGVTEDTANAVESYLNGMSQQAYLRNVLLTQIRDTVQSFDLDVQTATQAQMLLQLQNNYIVMQSMQSMMENWTVPSGNGIRVELLS